MTVGKEAEMDSLTNTDVELTNTQTIPYLCFFFTYSQPRLVSFRLKHNFFSPATIYTMESNKFILVT